MKQLFPAILLALASFPAHAAIQTREVVYQIDDKEFTGYLAWDDAIEGRRPGILVVHEWWGHNEYARRRARMLAGLGYTAFALDMYGSGQQPEHPDTAAAFSQAVTGDAEVMKRRFLAGLDMLRRHQTVDARRLAAIGYCMGGGIVLNMARAGIDLAGVAIFHGGLATASPAKPGDIKGQVLVLTGGADPFVPPEQVAAFEREMKAAGVHYRLVSYPGVKHSFTNPAADGYAERFGMPVAYDAKADRDSWRRMHSFFDSLFKAD